ncbi:MAG: hypothetical protein RLZZ400_317, partial [Actinomycetota bacterium]
FLWLRAASIRGPNDFQSFALPTELQSQGYFYPAILTGLEPATSAVTGRRANQLRYRTMLLLTAPLVTPTGFEPVLLP